MQGQGILSDKNQVKTGVFKDSKLNGTGIQQKFEGDQGKGVAIALKGDFKDDVLDGDTCELHNEKGLYKGQIKNGMIHGEGTMLYYNGDMYEGSWQFG